MKKQEIEELTRKALFCITDCTMNEQLSKELKNMEYLHLSQENYNAFLETFSMLKDAVDIQATFDNLTNLRNQAHFKMKRAQHNEWLMEYTQYLSEVDLYDKRIEDLKSR